MATSQAHVRPATTAPGSTTDDPARAASPTAHRRWFYVLLSAMTIALYAETFLRINGLLPESIGGLPVGAGEVLFTVATGAGVLGTLVLALTAPTPADRRTAPTTTADTHRSRTRPTTRPVLGH